MKKCKFVTASKGLFYAYAPDYEPVLVDPDYNGLKVVYKAAITPKIYSQHNTGFISDGIEIKSQADGKMYSSKSRYYQSLKDSGSHVIEKGEGGKPREIRGDYDVRKELTQALHQHLH